MDDTTAAEIKKALRDASAKLDEMAAQLQTLWFLLPFAAAGGLPNASDIAILAEQLEAPSEESRAHCVALALAVASAAKAIKAGAAPTSH